MRDSEAPTLEDLFHEHHASLFRFVARMTGDADYAMDIVQETFMSVALKPLPANVSAKACLFQIAQSLTLSGLRKTKRRESLLAGNAHNVRMGSALPPDVHAERTETQRAVRRALADLNEKDRTILLMREEGFTHREIADAVGTTTKSVGTMFMRALAKLEHRLANDWRPER